MNVVKYSTTIKITDYKKLDNNPVVASFVVLVKEGISTNVEIDRTVTTKEGYYEFSLPISATSIGSYQVQFYGGKTVREFIPEGDWEKFEITASFLQVNTQEIWSIDGLIYPVNNYQITFLNPLKLISNQGTEYSIPAHTLTLSYTASPFANPVNFIYFDPSISTTALQVTTNPYTPLDINNVIIGSAQVVEDVTKYCILTTFIAGPPVNYPEITAQMIRANTITANEINVADLFAQDIEVGGAIHSSGMTTYATGSGWWIGIDSSVAKLFIGNSSHSFQYDGTDILLDAVNLTNANITSIGAGTEPSIQGWQSNIVVTASDYNTVAWSTGSIILTDGTTYTISAASNTGNMTASTTYYIYFDKNVSETALQVSTTASNAVGAGKILMAVAQAATDTTKDAAYQVFGGSGGFNKLMTADSIASNTITANEIATNTITANEINLVNLFSEQIQIQSTGNIHQGFTTFNPASGQGFILGSDGGSPAFLIGDIDNSKYFNYNSSGDLVFVGGTITGGVFQTASSGQRVVLTGSPANNLIFYNSTGDAIVTIAAGIYSSQTGIKISKGSLICRGNNADNTYLSFYGDNTSSFGTEDILFYISSVLGFFISSSTNTKITIDTGGDFRVVPNIINHDIVYPEITVGGNDTTRTWTININDFADTISSRIGASSGVDGSNTRGLVCWWVSTSEFGDPVSIAGEEDITFSVTTGNNLDTISETSRNYAITDTSGVLVIQATTINDEEPVNVYLHVEIDGIVYSSVGTLYGNAAA